MSFIFLLAVQAVGQEITTFHPLPPKAQQERELRQVQGLLPVRPEPAPAQAPAPAKPVAPKAEPPKPADEDIKVMSVTPVRPDAVVVFVPAPGDPPPKP